MPTLKPWDRIPGPKSNPSKGEPDEAFEAFNCYLKLGPDRSLMLVGQELVKSRQLLSRWSARWKWVTRASAWDDHLTALKRNRLTKNLLKREERRLARDDEVFEIAQKIKAKLLECLAFPMAEVVLERNDAGQPMKVIRPAKWAMKDVAPMAKAFQQLLDEATAPAPGSAQAEAEQSNGETPQGPMFVEVEEVRREDQPESEGTKT